MKAIHKLVLVLLAFLYTCLHIKFIWLSKPREKHTNQDKVIIEKITESSNIESKNVSIISSTEYYKCNTFVHKCLIIALVSCGNNSEGTLTLIKSIVLLSEYFIVIELFTEESNFEEYLTLNNLVPQRLHFRIRINLREAFYPEGFNSWIDLYKKCATLRLFFPDLLQEVDTVLYIDIDSVLLAPIEYVWNNISLNNLEVIAAAEEHSDTSKGWYNTNAKHPFYGKFGINSGVLLMNLTRLRSFKFLDKIIPIESSFRNNIPLVDQDILNILFHYYPHKLKIFNCEFNYRIDQCESVDTCQTAYENGVHILHGSKGSFRNPDYPDFGIIYKIWRDFDYEDDIEDLYSEMATSLQMLTDKKGCHEEHRDAMMLNIRNMVESQLYYN